MADQLRVLIIGAGLGGLACAIACRRHGLEVTVLERASEILPVGAGIQIPPNAARVLKGLGILETLKETGVVLDHVELRRFENGQILLDRPGGQKMIDDYGAEWMVIHRGDYHQALLDEARRLNVRIRLNASVEKIDFEQTSVILSNGEKVQSDAIVGADGLWSTTRDLILSQPSPPVETGDLAYRGTFKLSQLRAINDPRIDELCNRKAVTVFYPVRSGKEFNLVLLRPDNLPSGARTAQGDVGEMRASYEGWDEILTKIISCITAVLKWKLCHHPELPSWTKNCVALLGDACHPTLPYQAQGAAMAVEDGAVLGHLLGMLFVASASRDLPKHIPSLLKLYESLRKSRTTLNVQGAIENRTLYHMRDGPAQVARDEALADVDWEKPCVWGFGDIGYQKSLLGHESVEEAEEAFERWWVKTERMAEE